VQSGSTLTMIAQTVTFGPTASVVTPPNTVIQFGSPKVFMNVRHNGLSLPVARTLLYGSFTWVTTSSVSTFNELWWYAGNFCTCCLVVFWATSVNRVSHAFYCSVAGRNSA
jgi:hypothetical protein